MIRADISGAVATITLSRPPVNAIDPAFVTALHAALDVVEKAASTAVVIRSDQKCFCAGADLALIRSLFASATGAADMVAYVKTLHVVFDRLERLDAVTIAAIDGPALGGGLELSLACDLRIVSARARIGLPEARVGMIPGAGGTQRLPRLAGPGVAARLILGGEVIDGAEAARLGIAQWVVAPEEIEPRAREIAGRIAGLSRQALVASKGCLAAWFTPGVDGFARELEVPFSLMATEEARSRVEAFFAPKSN